MEARSLARRRYLDLPYRIVLTRDADKGWIAYVEELPGCEATGESAEEAVHAIRESMEEWMRTATREGRRIPRPRDVVKPDGALELKVPQSLHESLIRAAVREGMALQEYITVALAAVVRWSPPADEREGRDVAARSRRLGLSTRTDGPWERKAMLANVALLGVIALAAIVLLAVALKNA